MNFPLSVSPRKEMGNRKRQRKKPLTSAGSSKSWVIMVVIAALCATKLRDKLQQTAPFVVTHAEKRSGVLALAGRHQKLFHYASASPLKCFTDPIALFVPLKCSVYAKEVTKMLG